MGQKNIKKVILMVMITVMMLKMVIIIMERVLVMIKDMKMQSTETQEKQISVIYQVHRII